MASTGKIGEITAAKGHYLLRLNKAASRCYLSNGTDEIQGSEFIRVLEDALIFLKNLHFDEEASECAYEILREAQSLTITDPKGQVLLDMVTLDLPKVILSYLDISENCKEICENVITHMCKFCAPSEIVSVLCEELSTLCETDEKLSASLYLLHGFSIVIGRIQRRPVENVKVALPIMLAVGKVAASKLSDDDSIDIASRIFEKLIAIAVSLQGVCKKQVVDEKKQQLWSILSLYTLQLLAFVSRDANITASTDASRAPASILQLSELLSDCGLSYLGLITGNEVEGFYHLLDADENDKIVENTSLINTGSILAVLWGYVFVEVATIARGNIEDLLKKLQSCQSERIRALSNMKYLLSSLDYPWRIKKYSIDFMLAMVNTNSASSKDSDEKIDWSSITPSLFSLSQAVQQIIVYAPDPKQRKEAFSALTKIFAELPADHKFDILKALIINSNYPSMTALLLGAVRSEIANAFQMTNTSKVEDSHLRSPFQTGDVLELVEFILKPQRGGPPDLPGQSDAVNILPHDLFN